MQRINISICTHILETYIFGMMQKFQEIQINLPLKELFCLCVIYDFNLCLCFKALRGGNNSCACMEILTQDATYHFSYGTQVL